EDVVVAGDILFLREHPELVFPDKMVDGRKTHCVDPFEDIPEPVPSGEDIHASRRGKYPRCFFHPAPCEFPILLFWDFMVPFKDIVSGPVIVQALGLEIYGKGRIRDNKIDLPVRYLRHKGK